MKKQNKSLVKLPLAERFQSAAVPMIAIVIGLFAGALIIGGLGANPFSAYVNLLKGSGFISKANYAGGKGMLTDLLSYLDALAPMIFAALAVAVGLKAGIFNIGVSGQMLLSGFIASAFIGYSSLPAVVSKPMVIVAGVIVGALTGALIGFLKYKFNINEVVSSIMINYIVQYLISFFINTRYLDPVSRQSKEVSRAARLTIKDVSFSGLVGDIPTAIILAVITALLLKFILDRTALGYELKAVGLSPKAASYTGISVPKSILTTMMISGGLAGLAGVSYYLGYYGSIQPKVLPSMGFDAVAVALLGNSNPVGIIFSSAFITIISKGSTYMSSSTGVEAEISSVITAVILLFCACSGILKTYLASGKKNRDRKKKGA